ncbi:MAG TPA: tetratricopeptide repeat protein [Thermoplasmata archaeon]|nr:tetratricopeptide repeat protein [Thermoplasmata archaeon]
MASSPFVQLAGALIEAMGQRLDAAKPTDEGLVLRTGDGFLYAFVEDPTVISLDTVRRLFTDAGPNPAHLVVLTPAHLPLALSEEVVRHGGTLVEGPRFAELARQLGLGSMLGEEPRPPRPGETRRLLPSAQQLDGIMHRARTWLDWGVPALALRFYRQAADLKPGFQPARVGVGRALLALRLTDDAERQFDEVLATRPDDLEARLGKAAVLGARARPKEEVEMYRALLAEDDARTEVRAHLLAALVDLGDWKGARVELEAMLSRTPEDPQLRFLHAIALERTGSSSLGNEEREEARRLGLTYEREAALCQHLGLPPPARPAEAAGTLVAPAVARRPSVPRRVPAPPKAARSPSRTAPKPAKGRATRKRK